MVDSGSCSDGFNTNVLPQTIAIGNIQSGIIAGKLNGVMPAQTPIGWRSVYVSTPPATFSENSPCCNVPIEHACSTTSSPRKISPSASGSVLPCSAVNVCAMRFMFWRTRSWNLSMMRMRVPSDVRRHVWNAFTADATAASTSSFVANGTRPTRSWVAGFTMSRHSFVVDSTNLPSISNLAVRTPALDCSASAGRSTAVFMREAP